MQVNTSSTYSKYGTKDSNEDPELRKCWKYYKNKYPVATAAVVVVAIVVVTTIAAIATPIVAIASTIVAVVATFVVAPQS